MCVLFEFRHNFNFENSSTFFQSFAYIFAKKSDLEHIHLSDCKLHYKRHLRRIERFDFFLKEERKCSDSSVVRG